MNDPTPAAGADRQILITRVFDVPRDMEAPSERINIDLRVGGPGELTMVSRDGGGPEFSIGSESQPAWSDTKRRPSDEDDSEPYITRHRPRRGLINSKSSGSEPEGRRVSS